METYKRRMIWQKDACIELGIKKQNLSLCIKDFNKTAGGFKWQYLN